MSVNLTAKITPTNDAFVGMVDAKQIIGVISGGGYLPSSSIQSGSVSELYLKISNEPVNGYYLSYSEANDLTWSEVVGGSDVAWSGASEFYSVSSNYNSHFNDSTIHFTKDSINIDDLANTSVDNVSGNAIVWNGSEWIDKNVTSEPGPSQLSTLSIDTDKDWSTYSIYNMTSVSSQKVSGGTITAQSITIGGGTIITQIKNGWGSVIDTGTIAHGCSSKPNCVCVSPSGSSPMMFSFKVDSTNITIYHTSPDSEVFSWYASV
jgi:hypothetical protein